MWQRAASVVAATALCVSACGTADRPVAVGQPQTPAAERELVLGVLPFALPQRVDQVYGPLAVALGEHLDRPVRLQTTESFADYTEDLLEGRFDIAVVHPFEHIALVDAGFVPLARVDGRLQTTIVSVPGAGFEGLSSLEGTTLGTPAAASPVAILAAQELRAAGLRPGTDVTIVAHQTHDACLNALELGVVDTCAAAPLPLATWEASRGTALEVVYQSDPIAPLSSVLAWPETPSDVVAEVMAFLITLDDVDVLPQGARYVPILPEDYDGARELAGRGP